AVFVDGYTPVEPVSLSGVLNATDNVFVFFYVADSDIEYTVHPYAVDGRILPASMTGDSSVWIEIARYEEYSLIVRKDYLNINDGIGYYGDPTRQFVSYSSSLINDYLDSDCWVRNSINDWFNGNASVSVDNLPVNARLHSYTVQNNATSSLGSCNADVAMFDSFSQPTSNRTGIGDDVAFALSFSESANFLSKTYNNSTGDQNSFFIAITSYNKLALHQLYAYGMWLRSPGDSSETAGYLDSTGRVFQNDTDSDSGSSDYGLIYPALWVHSSIFEL
ncbi:MAG: hypothetical protein LBH74_06480, partial [Nitrososphaerota archaeon]|nr:hypothetical protein [Nitrososphaerota archaeon]